MKKLFYFAYGSNLDSEQMKSRIKNEPKIEGKGVLYNYVLKFNKYPGGYANIVKKENSKVIGLVYELSEKEKNYLDCYEGVPDHYKVIKCIVKINNKEIKCFYLPSEKN